jgi:acetyl esterase/lipase
MATDQKSQGPKPSEFKPDEIRVYKTVDDNELGAHIFFPKEDGALGKRPGFTFFHPGGWSMGMPEWGYDLCQHFANLGMVAVSFQYRLSSPTGYTPIDAISDVKSALRWTREQANELNIDPGQVVAGAISAGAHLAACAAMIPGYNEPNDNPDISPVPDALILQSACLNPTIVSEFSDLLQGRDRPENCSPSHHIKAGLPPMCLIHGTADVIISFDSIKEFAEKTREMGNRCDLHPFEGTDHFFTQNVESSSVLKLTDKFLASLGYIG